MVATFSISLHHIIFIHQKAHHLLMFLLFLMTQNIITLNHNNHLNQVCMILISKTKVGFIDGTILAPTPQFFVSSLGKRKYDYYVMDHSIVVVVNFS